MPAPDPQRRSILRGRAAPQPVRPPSRADAIRVDLSGVGA
jgi:hypothetical protein